MNLASMSVQDVEDNTTSRLVLGYGTLNSDLIVEMTLDMNIIEGMVDMYYLLLPLIPPNKHIFDEKYAIVYSDWDVIGILKKGGLAYV